MSYGAIILRLMGVYMLSWIISIMKSNILIIIAVAIVLIMSVLLFSLNVFKRSEASELYAPIASLSPGNYSSAQSVILSCLTSDANIYYIINGDTPDITKTFYIVSGCCFLLKAS